MPWLVDIPEPLLAELKQLGPQIEANFLELLNMLTQDPYPRARQPEIEQIRPLSNAAYAADFGGGVLSYLVDQTSHTVRAISIAWVL